MKRMFFAILIMTSCVLSFYFSASIFPGTSFAGQGKYKLTQLWETPRDLRVPESVLYHETGKTLYVSNINGKPAEKNGQGFISKVTLEGHIEVLEWATGLNAPKGSAVYKDRFYVSDIDRLVEIDLETGKIVAEYPARGARFLNDVVTDVAGNVYVSDMDFENSVIYKLEKGVMKVWLRDPEIDKPNGLYMEDDRLLVGNTGDGSLKAVDLTTRKVSTLASVGLGIDGLRGDGKGNYFISNWHGKTSVVTASGQVTTLMDTTPDKINSADLEYIKGMNLLLIPTFFDNRVVAYRVEKVDN